MFLFVIYFILAVVFWIISIIFNDIEDGLQYYYDDSIFDWIPKESWWSWYMVDPDDSWQRKYNEDGSRKTWFGIPIPSAFLDGWHGAKMIRQFFQYLTYFMGLLGGYALVSMVFPEWFLLFFVTRIIFAVTNYLTHEVYVFEGLIRKEWWIDQGKEEIIKKFLDKHF